MAKAEASVEELVGMIERGELRLPEMQRKYVWRAPRVRDLLDSLYRGYPSGVILLWETDESVPQQEFAVAQQRNPYQSTRLLLDGQQRLTSLSAVIRGEHVSVRGRRKPIDLLFNLEHPDHLEVITEVHEDDGNDEDEDLLEDDETDSTEDELQRRFEKMTFVVATKKLASLPHWVKVSEVFKTDEDAPFLSRAGIEKINDPRYKKYSQRLARLRGIRKYSYRMDVLERNMSYDEVTEIFVRVNSLGAKLRSSDLALAQITAKWRNSLATFPGVPGPMRERRLRPGPRYPPEEHDGVRDRPVALPDGGRPVGRPATVGVAAELPRDGVRDQLPEEQPRHRQSRLALLAVPARGARVVRPQARLSDRPRRIGGAPLLGAGGEREGPLLKGLERDDPRPGPGLDPGRRRPEDADRPAAPPSGPARRDTRGTGGPQSAQRAL